MSHITRVNLKVKSLAALKEAAGVLGATFREDQHTYRSFYGSKACAHAISVPKAEYEIGVLNPTNADGEYGLEYDQWGPGAAVTDVIGTDGNRLKQEYAVAVAAERAQELAWQGFEMSRENLDNGNVRLRFRR